MENIKINDINLSEYIKDIEKDLNILKLLIFYYIRRIRCKH